MIEKRYLVLDIETVLDTALIKQVFNLGPDSTLDEIREQIKTKYPSGFLPPPYHVPICIALLDVDSETCKVQNAAVLENSDEKTLLQQFWKIVKYRKGNIAVRTILIHFNGRSFDLPVLFYRSMKHQVPVVVWERNRYSFEYSHDICDDLSEFGAVHKPSLDVLAKMLGLPGKTDIHGSKVEELYLQGERSRIKDYCMEDAVATYHIWLTLKLIRGEISEEKYLEGCQTATDIVRNCRSVTDSFFGIP